MVCLQDEGSLKVSVQDSEEEPCYISLTPTKPIKAIFKEIAEKYACQPDEIEITLKADANKIISTLSNHKDKTVSEVSLRWSLADVADYELVVTLPKNNMALRVPHVSEDDPIWGASASPTTSDLATSSCDDYPTVQFNYEPSRYNQGRRMATQLNPVIVESTNYVGLVNQAMTCYLNSLLQALYMTPEFRNALYNWEFDDGANETRSIPYQLQKLFLNLQTSSKSAVETTDLTTSFGWQGSDAWHQHDIQELCRVMFDALEQKFKDTKQANLINDLYEGKMLDYVKCLECGTEKSREDTFLDIPLPVRPFGSLVAYNSVEEALRAFVQPETLDGNNQYFCEKCNKKCDAHKGLKFTKFPYLLTLHLKRFDFDYSTMHRIKLNDKVVFSEKLNLNSFIPVSRTESEHPNIEGDTIVKCDDSSTTDSGSADDESCQGTDLSSTVNGQDDNCADSDEGIDVSSGNNHHENEAKGPYVYELFSIMIHSGSASGGHYYAYIKDFDKNLWFCFNDQSVSPITEDDIKKTYGGGPQRTYYSGAYSSSTNAYMLMYRQIDKERNSRAMAVNDFPPHIKILLQNMKQKEEQDRLNRKKEDEMIKINVTIIHPITQLPQDLKISTFCDSTFAEVAQHAYNRFKLESSMVDARDCRIVVYNKKLNCIDYSFESEDIKFNQAMEKYNLIETDWMLEIKEPGALWKKYKKGGVNMKVYLISLETDDIEEPKLVRVDVGETVGVLKEDIGQILEVNPNYLKVALGMHSNEPTHFKEDTEVVHFDSNCSEFKLYAACTVDKDTEAAKKSLNKFKKLAEMFSHIISLNVAVPDTDEGTLESLSIPSLDFNQNIDKHDQTSDRGTNSPSLRVSPQPGPGGMCGDGYDQSNSEDSSLSDSDRTLIGDAPTAADCLALLPSSSTSPADQHMASPSDPCQDTYNYDVMGRPGEEMHWNDAETQMDNSSGAHQSFYFRVAADITETDCSDRGEASNRKCKVLVDKRMSLESFKKQLELVLRVPSEYFKVFKHHPIRDDEWSRLSDTLRPMKDDERLTVKLGRVLRDDEQQCKVYHLKPDNMELNNLLFEHILTKNQTVGSAKKDILQNARKQNLLDIPYNRCRLREKSWKKPKKVYLDDQKFNDDIPLTYTFELFLQELTEPETVTSNNQVVVFLRKFSPSALTLGPFQEAVLELITIDDLRMKVSEVSGIPLENLDVAHVKGNYPYDTHLLEIHEDLDWDPNAMRFDQLQTILDDGSMFLYKDNRETPKELTPEEKKDLKQREDARLGRPSLRTYSPGRERALKIYLLDTSPSKTEDDID